MKEGAVLTRIALTCALWISLLSPSADAGLIIDESFGAPLGDIPADWTRIGTGNSQTIVEDVGPSERTMLEMDRRDGLIYEPASGPTQFADLEGSVIINTGEAVGRARGGSFGILLRLNQVAMAGTFDPPDEPEGSGEPGYKIIFASDRNANNTTNAPYLAIYSGQVNEGQQHNEGRTENLVTTWLNTADITRDTDYTLTFSALGSTISASLWTVAVTPVLLGEVTLTDAAYTGAGYFGLNVTGESSGTTGYYSNLEVIPEPGTLSLILTALALLGLLRRRL